MILDVCLGSKSSWRILALYAESPGAGFTRQDIREYTKLGNKALSLALKRLIAFRIILKTKEQTSLALYKLNKGNEYANEIINLLQKERIGLNYLPYDFIRIVREFIREIVDSLEIKSVYLFGSVAKGTYRKDSDVDFAVIVKSRDPGSDIIVNKISEKLGKRFKRKIQCFLIPEKEFKEKKKFNDEILKHGIRIV